MRVFWIYDNSECYICMKDSMEYIQCTIKDFEEKYLHEFNVVTDIIVKGDIQSDNFLRFVLKHFNPSKKFLSHIFVFKPKDLSLPNFCVTDCVLNQYPDLNTRVKITDNAIDFYKNNIDNNVIINFLSHSGHYSIKNKTACESLLLKEHYNNKGIIATDFQLDAALDADLQRNKNKDSKETYVANILVANDINEGNSIMKSFLINKQYNIYGYVLGASTNIILNSRSNLEDNDGAIQLIKSSILERSTKWEK